MRKVDHTQRDARLRSLVDQGLYSSKIAIEMGMSSGWVRGRMSILGLKSKHDGGRNWTEAQLIEAVKTSDSYSQVIEKIGLKKSAAGNYSTIQRYVEKLGLDTAHWRGQRWLLSRPSPLRRELVELLVENSQTRSHHLRPRLLAEGVFPAQCSRCKLMEWQGESITLELDHVNGDNTDNRLENLRMLCPNCHALTPTWRGRKNKVSLIGETGITRV